MIQGMMPFFQWLLNVLAQVVTTFSQAEQILFGVRIQVSGTANSLQNAADAAGSLADNTEAAGKAAKGALASFDQLNVLQQNQGGTSMGGLGTLGPAMASNYTQTVGMLQQLGVVIAYYWNKWVVGAANTAVQLRDIIEYYIFDGLNTIVTDVKMALNLMTIMWQALGYTVGVIWNDYIVWYALEAWAAIQKVWNGFPAWFQGLMSTIGAWFSGIWVQITKWVNGAAISIQDFWDGLPAWFDTNVITPIQNDFNTMLTWLGTAWNKTFTGIRDFVKSTINSILGFINSMISAVVSGMNTVIKALDSISVSVPTWVPDIGGDSWGVHIPYISAPKIPLLATGAVIPPNAAFAAVLGDQTNGRNLELPESLLDQKLDEKFQKYKNDQSITINFAGNMATLVQVMKPYIDKENIRVGPTLVRTAGSTS